MKIILLFTILMTLCNAKLVRFNDGNVVIDTKTKLMWSDHENKTSTWSNALIYCNTLNRTFTINSQSFVLDDWRLPNQNEISSLIDYTKTNSAFSNAFLFLAPISNNNYFSSTTYKRDETKVYGINNGSGLDVFLLKSSLFFVKCVRDFK